MAGMGLTPKATAMLAVIRQSFNERGFAPSYDDMRNSLGFKSKNSIARLLNQLEDRGYITRRAKQARAIELVRHPNTRVCCPNCSHEFEPALFHPRRGETLGSPQIPSTPAEGEFLKGAA
ncbi:MAG TPA: helix-turn-helix domain-containing protein [Terriglobales bacterium]|nr:helix-turn-helix domain-containing protein [Terriglobales bacterium]